MIDDIKKYIDKVCKEKLKANGNDFEKAGVSYVENDKKKVVDYGTWLLDIMSQEVKSHYPNSVFKYQLLDIMSIEVFYKYTLKDVLSIRHPVLEELSKSLNLTDEILTKICNKSECISSDYISSFNLFRDEYDLESYKNSAVVDLVTTLSEDSIQGSIISHSPKMTHPGLREPKLNKQYACIEDGFLKSGAVEVEFDLHINAVKLKVYKLLSLKVGVFSLLDLIETKNYATISSFFRVDEELAKQWCDNFYSCISPKAEVTDGRLKQIYFPVGDKYHLLSILTPSGLVFEVKNRIDLINKKSPQAYEGWKCKSKNRHCSAGFSSIYDLTVTRHGGDHPKNISALNNKYQTYYLLRSMPPVLHKRDLHFPTRDFFAQSVYYGACRAVFVKLHDLYKQDSNNIKVRNERDEYYQDIIDYVIEKLWQIRAISKEQFLSEYSQLSKSQRIWLQVNEAPEDDAWLDDVLKQITHFLFNGYERTLAKKAIKFGDSEFQYMQKMVEKNKEIIR